MRTTFLAMLAALATTVLAGSQKSVPTSVSDVPEFEITKLYSIDNTQQGAGSLNFGFTVWDPAPNVTTNCHWTWQHSADQSLEGETHSCDNKNFLWQFSSYTDLQKYTLRILDRKSYYQPGLPNPWGTTVALASINSTVLTCNNLGPTGVYCRQKADAEFWAPTARSW